MRTERYSVGTITALLRKKTIATMPELMDAQHRVCDPHRLTVTVAHYPSGASKWNPIEHRLFSEISKNWAGVPLETYETILNFIQTTATKTGLRVQSTLVNKNYETGVKITNQQMASLSIDRFPVMPQWNYTIKPH